MIRSFVQEQDVEDEEVRLDQGRHRQHPTERQHAEPAQLERLRLRRFRRPRKAGAGCGERGASLNSLSSDMEMFSSGENSLSWELPFKKSF